MLHTDEFKAFIDAIMKNFISLDSGLQNLLRETFIYDCNYKGLYVYLSEEEQKRFKLFLT